MCENAVMPLKWGKCTLVAILGLKCSKLLSNPVDLVCQNAVMPLKWGKCTLVAILRSWSASGLLCNLLHFRPKIDESVFLILVASQHSDTPSLLDYYATYCTSGPRSPSWGAFSHFSGITAFYTKSTGLLCNLLHFRPKIATRACTESWVLECSLKVLCSPHSKCTVLYQLTLLLQIRVGWKHVKMTFVLLAIMLKTEPFRGSKPGQELYMRHDGQSVIVCRQSTVAPHSSYDQNGILPSSVAKAPCCSTTGQPAGAVRTDQEDFSIHSSGFRSYSGALGWQHMPLPVLYWRYFTAGWQTYMFYRDDWDKGSPGSKQDPQNVVTPVELLIVDHCL